MDFWTIALIVATIGAGLAAIAFVLFSIWVGCMVLFGLAAVQGFVGVAAFIACWIFLFPLMLAVSFLVGAVIVIGGMRSEAPKIAHSGEEQKMKALDTAPAAPPRPEMGTPEYQQWANREGRYRNT